MKRFLLPLIAFLFVLNVAATAKASCEDITIGANILIVGLFQNDYDFNNDTSDSYSYTKVTTRIHLYNTYTDNVSTHIRFDGKVTDASKSSLLVDRAYITIKEFLTEGLTVKIGKNGLSWQMRKITGAEALYHISPGDINSAFVFYVKPVGMDFVYKFNKTSSLNFGVGKVKEGSVAGNNANDVTAYYARYDHKLGETNKFFIGLVYYVDHQEILPGDLFYMLGGIDYFLAEEALELYCEFSYQGGDAHSESYDLGAFAFNLGGEYTFADVKSVPYIGVDITCFTGASDDTYGYIRYMASWTRTLIGEADYFTSPWSTDFNDMGDSNYRSGYFSAKLRTGLKSIADDKFGIDCILAFFKADGDDASSGKGLGWEFDIIGSYFYSEDVSFVAGIGYFNAHEDLGGEDADAIMLAVFGVNILF